MDKEIEIEIEAFAGKEADKSAVEEIDGRMNTLVEAFSEEVARILKRLGELDRRLGKFERMFEGAFREEAERRLGLRGAGAGLDAELEASLSRLSLSLLGRK